MTQKDDEENVLKTCLPKSLLKFKKSKQAQKSCDVTLPDFKDDRYWKT